jgi:hypothetical protein
MKTMKKFTFGMAVLLGVSLFLTGCPTEAETETKYVTVDVPGPSQMVHIDVEAEDVEALKKELAKTGSLNIGLTGTATLDAAVTIPADKLVYILNGAVLDTGTFVLTVEGVVTVGYGGTLEVPDGSGKVSVTDGTVGVVQGGTLAIINALSVDNGKVGDNLETVLGTSKAVITQATLNISEELADLAAVKGALDYLSSGTLAVKAAVKPSGITAATVADLPTSATKLLALTSNTEEDGTTISIPAKAGLSVYSSDDLDSATAITVDEGGVFYANSGMGATAGVTLTANGYLSFGGGAKLLASTVGAKGTLSLGGDIAWDDAAALGVVNGSTVYAGSVGIIFPAATSITAIVTTGGSEELTIGDIEIPENGTFAASTAKVTLSDGKKITLNTGASLFGTFKAGATTILGGGGTSGGWKASGEAATEIVSSAAGATITGGTLSGGSGSSITQAAGSGNALTIAKSATVNLGGTADVAGASIKLTQEGTNPGSLALVGTIYTRADNTGGANYSTLTSVGGFTLGTSIDKDSVFQDSNKLTKLFGAEADNTLTANTTGSDTDDIDSQTTTAGS